MATALDQSPSNPGGLPAYQWTDWQQVFRPQIGAQLAVRDQSGNAMSGPDILAKREADRNSVIQNNPLWAGAKRSQPAGMFADVNDAGSSGEDAQSMFGAVNDGMAQPIAAGPSPGAGRDFRATPAPTPAYGRTIYSTKYGGYASVRFNTPGSNMAGGMGLGNKMYTGGGNTFRF
jgi:hypothetical protein